MMGMNLIQKIYYFFRAGWYLTAGRWTHPDEYIAHKIAWEIVFEGKHQELLKPVEEK